MNRLRTQVVQVFDRKHKRIRSPWLFLATHEDAFIDPFAALAKHVLVKIRTLAWSNPELATKILSEAARQQGSTEQTTNGIAAVAGYVCNMLQWELSTVEPFRISKRTQGTCFNIKEGSKSFLLEELESDCRSFMINQVPERHDFFGDLDSIDIFRTRFLHDSSSASNEEMELLRPFVPALPSNFQRVRSILAKLWSGQIFRSARCKAAGLGASDSCAACGEREDHLHLFKFYPFYQQSRPQFSSNATTWCTGIFPQKDRKSVV